MPRYYSDSRDEKPKRRPQMKSRCQLKRVLTRSRESAEQLEMNEITKFRNSQEETPKAKKPR